MEWCLQNLANSVKIWRSHFFGVFLLVYVPHLMTSLSATQAAWPCVGCDSCMRLCMFPPTICLSCLKWDWRERQDAYQVNSDHFIVGLRCLSCYHPRASEILYPKSVLHTWKGKTKHRSVLTSANQIQAHTAAGQKYKDINNHNICDPVSCLSRRLQYDICDPVSGLPFIK